MEKNFMADIQILEYNKMKQNKSYVKTIKSKILKFEFKLKNSE